MVRTTTIGWTTVLVLVKHEQTSKCNPIVVWIKVLFKHDWAMFRSHNEYDQKSRGPSMYQKEKNLRNHYESPGSTDMIRKTLVVVVHR